MRELLAHSSSILSLAFNPDGKTLASSSSDNTIRLWVFNLYFMFLKDGKPTPLFFAFAAGTEFFWQVKREGLEFKRKEVIPTLYSQEGYYFYDPKYHPLLNPPKAGQSKFEQILKWAQVEKGVIYYKPPISRIIFTFGVFTVFRKRTPPGVQSL